MQKMLKRALEFRSGADMIEPCEVADRLLLLVGLPQPSLSIAVD